MLRTTIVNLVHSCLSKKHYEVHERTGGYAHKDMDPPESMCLLQTFHPVILEDLFTCTDTYSTGMPYPWTMNSGEVHVYYHSHSTNSEKFDSVTILLEHVHERHQLLLDHQKFSQYIEDIPASNSFIKRWKF